MSTRRGGEDHPNTGPLPPEMPHVDHLPAGEQIDAILIHHAGQWERHEPIPARQYLDAYPLLREDVAAAEELLYQDYLLAGGDRSPELLAGYLRDHPAYADALRRLCELGQVVAPILPSAAPAPPRRIGDYELLQEIGRGGMGVVWKARQVSLNRFVALKLIRDPERVSADTLERFRREARAAAGLSHANLVAVYEVGEEAGQHYIALEYVEGGTLAKRVRENPLPASEAARVVEMLARAVQHAHERGVIHRDLKPANVLLATPVRARSVSDGSATPPVANAPGSDGEPKITDFGLARLIAPDHSLTASGQVIGTPGYMAPEQARGEHKVGPAADVYGLGAILYELLTRRPPFSAATPIDTLRQVIDHDPVSPRALNASIPLDLDTICLKCLQKEPAARYASAADLADDLGRFQRGETVRARPAGRLTRSGRWCRRNKAVAALTAGLFVSLVAGLAGLLWQLGRVEQQRGVAVGERDRAQANLTKARGAVAFIAEHIAPIRLRNMPQAQEVQREVLEYALTFHEGLLAEDEADPAVRLEVVKACVRVGDARAQLGNTAGAEEAYRRAITLVEGLPIDYPDPLERHQLLIGCYGGLHKALRLAGLDARSDSLGVEAALERLFASYPENHRSGAGYRKQLASFLHNKAIRADPSKGVALLQQALALTRPLSREHPDDWQYKEMEARSCNMLAVYLRRLRRPGEALRAYEEARLAQEQLASRFPGDATHLYDLAITTRNLVPLFRTTKDYPAAEKAARQAEELWNKLTRDYPSVPAYHSHQGALYQDLALVHVEKGQPAEALVLLEKATACQRRALEPDVRNRAYRQLLCGHCYHRADIHLNRGEHESAARAAAEMARYDGGRAMDFYAAAGLFARCAAAAEQDARLPLDKRAELARRYDEEAFRILDQLAPARRIPGRDVRSLPEVAPLSRYEEFRKHFEADKKAPGK